MFCPECGTQNYENAMACVRCGALLRPSPVLPQAPPKVPSYLVQAILVTLFCCMPCGIVAIVYAALAMGRASAGDYAGALAKARVAKTWCWVAFVLGLAWLGAYGLFIATAANRAG